MPMESKITHEIAASHNRQLILRLLRHHKTLSRQQLSEKTRLHRSTLSKVIGEFEQQGIVRAVGKVQSGSVGRNQILLELVPDRAWVLGIELHWDWAEVVLLDSVGKAIDHGNVRVGHDLPLIAPRLKTFVDTWLDQRGQPDGPLLGVGLGLPGMVDPVAGTVAQYDDGQWNPFPLADALKDMFQVQVKVNNSTRMAALAELNNHGTIGLQNLVYFTMNYHHADNSDTFVIDEFGTALVLNGAVHQGTHAVAGEVQGLLREALQNQPVLTQQDIHLLATPDGEFTKTLEAMVAWISPFLASLTSMLDPERVILGGQLQWHNREALARVQARLNEQLHPALPEHAIEVTASLLTGNTTAIGAGLQILDQMPIRSDIEA